MINFDLPWYFITFAATLYLSIFVWSSDFLSFVVFMNVVILVFIKEDSDIDLGGENDPTEGNSIVYRFFQDMKLKGATVQKQINEDI